MAENISAARAPWTIRIVWYWLPVVMMFGLMYYFSTDVFSADNTRNIFEKIFLWFSPNATKRSILTYNYFLRKSAHFTEYAILGGLLFRAFRAGDPVRWRLKWALQSFVFATSWALLDELHQNFTNKRSGSIWDSLLDSSGALFMLTAIWIVVRRPRVSASS
jgi:VanZ family protein